MVICILYIIHNFKILVCNIITSLTSPSIILRHIYRKKKKNGKDKKIYIIHNAPVKASVCGFRILLGCITKDLPRYNKK